MAAIVFTDVRSSSSFAVGVNPSINLGCRWLSSRRTSRFNSDPLGSMMIPLTFWSSIVSRIASVKPRRSSGGESTMANGTRCSRARADVYPSLVERRRSDALDARTLSRISPRTSPVPSSMPWSQDAGLWATTRSGGSSTRTVALVGVVGGLWSADMCAVGRCAQRHRFDNWSSTFFIAARRDAGTCSKFDIHRTTTR